PMIPWSSDRNGLLIGRGLAGDDGDRGQAAASVDRFAREIATAVESMRLDKERVRKAIGADRSRIARELHDGVVQTLFAAAFRLQLHADEVPKALRTTIQQTTAGIREAINDIQAYVHGLEPSLVMLGGLAASLKQLAVEFESSSGIPVTVDLELHSGPGKGALVRLLIPEPQQRPESAESLRV